jgi:predicted ArsR family transcriptional regulator
VPVSRDEAADAVAIARHTAKFHLDKLAKEGLLDTSFKRHAERRGRVPDGPPSCTGGPAGSCQ